MFVGGGGVNRCQKPSDVFTFSASTYCYEVHAMDTAYRDAIPASRFDRLRVPVY